MSLSWEARKRLLRMTGMAEELLVSARMARHAEAAAAVGDPLAALRDEIHALLAQDDALLAQEFERVVVGSQDVPTELRAATLTGWLKAALAVETLDEQRREKARVAEPQPSRKQTIGFKIRSPIARESAGQDEEPRG